MNYDVLYNFISPVTGKVLSDTDYVLVGDPGGIATPSPILIDMRLDMIDIKHDFDSLAASSFIVGFPNAQLPNSQVLSTLNNGFMYNTGGIVSTTSNVPLSNLTYNNIWIGDVNNRPQPKPTISMNNLPTLGIASITVSGGKIWHGTASNRPEESTALLAVEADVTLLNFRFLTSNFILGRGNPLLQTLMPGSQFLSNLSGGILKSAPITGVLSNAIPGVDYATEASVVEAQAAADAAATAAAAAPAEGAALAYAYFNEQMLPYSLIPLAPVGVSISGAIAAAAAIGTAAAVTANEAKSEAEGANTRIDNLGVTLKGAIIASGNLTVPIETAFAPNPIFHGTKSMIIPAGNISQRPNILIPGMIRINIL
jgi:hypothetical protein